MTEQRGRGIVIPSLSSLEPAICQASPRFCQEAIALSPSFPARQAIIVESVEQLESSKPDSNDMRASRVRCRSTTCTRTIPPEVRVVQGHHLADLAANQRLDAAAIALDDVRDSMKQTMAVEDDVGCRSARELLELPGEFHTCSVRRGRDIRGFRPPKVRPTNSPSIASLPAGLKDDPVLLGSAPLQATRLTRREGPGMLADNPLPSPFSTEASRTSSSPKIGTASRLGSRVSHLHGSP